MSERPDLGASRRTVRIRVNGRVQEHDVSARTSLADFLREGLGLTGTHVGCEHGVCGACTVSVNGELVRACLMLAVQADGASVTTIEGIGDGRELHAVQRAFWNHHGLQCGFCTPAMVLTAIDLLQRNPDPDEAQVREHMSGNLCRCTGYQFIVASVLAAARELRGQGVRPESGAP